MNESRYGLLTTEERLIVFLRAKSRDDKQEIQRVLDASPRIVEKMVDFSPDLRALRQALECLRNRRGRNPAVLTCLPARCR